MSCRRRPVKHLLDQFIIFLGMAQFVNQVLGFLGGGLTDEIDQGEVGWYAEDTGAQMRDAQEVEAGGASEIISHFSGC